MKELMVPGHKIKHMLPLFESEGFEASHYFGGFLKYVQDLDKEFQVFIDDDFFFVKDNFHIHGMYHSSFSHDQLIKKISGKFYFWKSFSSDFPGTKMLVLEKTQHNLSVRREMQGHVSLEDILPILELYLPDQNHSAVMRRLEKSLSQNGVYAVFESGKLKFLQVFDGSELFYRGYLLWSDLPFGETFRHFELAQSGNYEKFRTWINSDNEASLALHRLSGYQITGTAAVLFKRED